MADREPQRPVDRPSGEMIDAPGKQSPDHAAHDLDVLAAAADRTVDDATRLAAERQVAECRDCAALFADLRLLSTGLGALPRELAVSRDFRISPERAAQLRPVGWRGALQGLFGSGPSVRPFANALMTLGIAGLLLTVGLPGVIGGLGYGSATGAGAPAAEQDSGGAVGQGTGGSKAGSSAAPAENPVGAPGVVSSPTTSRDLVSSAYPYGSNRLNEYNAGGHTSPGPVATATDSLAQPEANPTASAPTISIVGILAAASLGALLLGLFLLVRSRARPFDSAR